VTAGTWLTFCLTTTVACLTPGQAVLFVVSAALARGAGPGMAAAGGILAANVLWIVLSATGIAAVVVTSATVFAVLKWTGAAYLVFLGVRMLFSTPAAAVAAPSAERGSRVFLRGVLVQGANPTAPVFFLALLPQFVDPAGAVGRQLFVLGASSLVIELVVLAFYVYLGVRARDLVQGRLGGWLERACAVLLIAAGARLVLVRMG
jgi:threonine/homoserine/homoserine lactone efflux protein